MISSFRITRRAPRPGRIERPWRDRDGCFVLGDPAHGAARHHAKHAVRVKTLGEVADHVARGFAVRMSDGDSPPSLIASDSLLVEPVEVEDESGLWTETGSKPPFAKDEMFAELRRVLLVFASQIAHAGSRQAALAFIGFQTESLSPYCGDSPDLVDLARFAATGYLDQAYDFAFQVGTYWTFGDEAATDMSEFLAGAPRQASNGTPSPLVDPNGLCRRAADTAFARWKLDRGLDLTIRELALLADMTEAATRNSLSREKIAAERGGIANQVAQAWLNARRGFVPTRTGEALREQWVARSRFILEHEDFGTACRRLLAGQDMSPSQLAAKAEVEELFVRTLLDGSPAADIAALTRVGEALELDAPHFVGIAIQAALRAAQARPAATG